MKKDLIINDHIAVFNDHKIRRTLINDEWWFSVIDVIEALTDSANPRDYWYKMKVRVKNEEASELSTFCRQLKLSASDGKMRETDCANTEGMLRIIQSIPSPKAEPFKRWLAKVGYERVQEIEDPELASQRAREIYKAKGYDDSWIEKRMRGIQVRGELTEEWKNREVGGTQEYAILTAEISKAAFGLTPTEYKKHKGLERENLRDHMTDLELIFTMLGEASTTEIARENDAQGFEENRSVSRSGGEVAGNARKDLEKRTRKKVVTPQNYLEQTQKKIDGKE
ncbi:MAG: Bro-N domain-containing protein [Gammaproteobacteria bacterium]|nr:Bro-N domain-containing protein [Gammaproteobacteria bacterium]